MYDTINMKRYFILCLVGFDPCQPAAADKLAQDIATTLAMVLENKDTPGGDPCQPPTPTSLARSLSFEGSRALALSIHTQDTYTHIHVHIHACAGGDHAAAGLGGLSPGIPLAGDQPPSHTRSLRFGAHASQRRCAWRCDACASTRPLFSLRKAHVRAVCVCRVCTRADYRGWGGASGASQRNARAARRWAPALWRHAGSCTPPNTAPICSGVHSAMSLHNKMQETTSTCSRLHIVCLYMYTHRTVTVYSGRL